MAFILFDNISRDSLSPLSLTKAIADFRFGILTIKERWTLLLREEAFVHTAEYLQGLYPVPEPGIYTWIDASVIPTEQLVAAIQQLKPGQALAGNGGLVAGKSGISFTAFSAATAESFFEEILPAGSVSRIEYPWELMQLNEAMIREDFKLVTRGRKSQPVSPTVQLVQQADIFIEEGAKLEFCTLNSGTGPIYIGKHAEIMEGTTVRGPFVLGNHSVLKMNSRVYGATTLGPYCMGGGEIKNSILMGYSNKAHDGYLGDSVVGEWCNFGAGSSNSNLKNSAGDIKVWVMGVGESVVVGQKCGVIMGDYSRLAINSSVNTGSVIGLCCNVFGAGLLPRIITSFSWGTGGKKYNIEAAVNDINNWKYMKGKKISDAEIQVLKHIFHSSL
ncbi:MAG: glucose-1-phosphate thymidylyltransferase [Sphingobacteriia bacterium]|nr:glucose-1-phosphate thymidylyltransferase [Sphingobacteriia bacterium]